MAEGREVYNLRLSHLNFTHYINDLLKKPQCLADHQVPFQTLGILVGLWIQLLL